MTRSFNDVEAELDEHAPQVDGPQWVPSDNAQRDDGAPSPFVDPDAYASPPSIRATPFRWKDPTTFALRPWVYGQHLLRRQMSLTVAAGGVGKSSLTIIEAVAMASGRKLLGDWTEKDLKVWQYNLEDPRDEMERRIIAAMLHHGVSPEEVEGRLFIDTGRERALTTAIQTREGVQIIKPELDALAAEITRRGIDVLIIDPFVSSHRVAENDNGAIDLVAKEWAKLADRCNCAVELVHHIRKTNGADATTEDGRGGYALTATARSGRVLNKMSAQERAEAGLTNDPLTYFSVARDKANLAPAGAREWRRVVSVPLGNGDTVGVVERWEWPDAFEGMDAGDLLAVQRAIQARCDEGNPPRANSQANGWVGVLVAEVLGLDPEDDRKRINKMISSWLKSEALVKGETIDTKGMSRPTVEVGEWAHI